MPKPKLRIRPLSAWEHETTEERQYGQFKALLRDTVWLIEEEIRRLGADGGILEIDFDEYCFSGRGDLPAPGAQPNSPCVQLSFYHPDLGLLRYPCDTYVNWTHNVRAIALTLEALRAIDRYGAAQHSAQYKGWQQLPPGQSGEASDAAGPRTLDEAVALVAGESGEAEDPEFLLRSRRYFDYCYRTAAKKLHPDSGGTGAKFKALQIAKELIDGHYADEDDGRKRA